MIYFKNERNINKEYVILRNMEIISKVSKGSKMDQIYIPKNRVDFSIGTHVIIKPLTEAEKSHEKPYFYNITSIEPIKLRLIDEVFNIIKNAVDYENIIITGSFLDAGFNFEDIDLLIISEEEKTNIEKTIELRLKIKNHVIFFNKMSFEEALRTDPLWRMMLSRCISKNRLKPIPNKKIDYKILDLHLLKSKPLVENFDYLNGKEKYKLTRNLMAIKIFVTSKKITKDKVNKEIEKTFSTSIDNIKNNLLNKNSFIKKYRLIYNDTFNKIMEYAKNEPKQK